MGTHFYAPVVVPDHTGTAVVEFSPLADGSVRIGRWPVIAWWIRSHEHSRQTETWIRAEPITTKGSVYVAHDDYGYLRYAITCLETNWFAGKRIWEFSNGTYFETWQAAQEYAMKELAEHRTFSAQAAKRKAAEKKREAKKRAVRRAERAAAVAATNGASNP